MDVENSMFETSEITANLITSTNVLMDSWSICNHANSPTSEGFVISQNGPIGLVSFAGLKDFRHGFGPNLMDMVPLHGGDEVNGPVFGLGCRGDDQEEIVMIHAGFLQLFLNVYNTPSFRTQMKTVLEQSKSIIVTGHSIGGALASLTTLWLLSYYQTTPAPHILCITFGSPLLGNKSLSKSLQRLKWTANFCHVVLRHDIVPRVLFAPLGSMNNHLHFLLQYIQSSKNMELSEEMKGQLFGFTLAYTDAAAKSADGNLGVPGVYWPFGSYLFCSEDGAICVDNSVSVIKLLHLMLATGGPGSCLEDHMNYGGCVERMSYQFLMNTGFMQRGVSGGSYEAGMALALQASGLASQGLISAQAKDCLQKSKQIGPTPNLNSATLAIALAKITPRRAQIEWYKTCCDESDNQLGYYDSFKQRQATRDNKVNMFRIKLGIFWDSVIDMIDRNELPHDFNKRRKFINASHFYQLLVEPLDIAEYYRSGEHLQKGHYLRYGRERRHEIFSKWWREREVVEKESKRSKFASLTQDSCFWARVEEARELLEKVRTEKNSISMVHSWQGIDEFEQYAREMVESKEVSSDVVAKSSSYRLWVEEVKELRSQMQSFKQIPVGFLGGEMVP